uniref:Putative ovule protein n=1 Tax=Solanum chacoense TaxID=4108 RepID=A0A0V0GYC1_SOLCH
MLFNFQWDMTRLWKILWNSLGGAKRVGDRSEEKIQLRDELEKPLQQLQDSARRIAEIQHECKLEIDVDKYVVASVRPFLMDVIYCWSMGASFAEVIQMTDIFEGSITRLARRLDEFLNQVNSLELQLCS